MLTISVSRAAQAVRQAAGVRNIGVRCLATSSYGDEKPFDKILIANRGEIACRVIRTARKLGVKTVAVYSTADANALHTRMADEAIWVGPAPSAQSYLVEDNILDAIKKTGAQAVHPGYGFLSENAHFAQHLNDSGITFIGPPPKAITAMGDKIESKKLAKAAGVNTIPGFLGEVHDDEEVLKVCHEIGFPVMIKASAGGGGKGMRIAWNDQEALEGFRLSKDEAKSSFGDDRMFIEKYIVKPRHIEIQIVADSHGNAVYLPERECSIQRRNQKVIEEAPSTFIDPETRKKMGEQAVMLAKAVGYASAGTVEFVVGENRDFYFLEMNTRLQVEHPITEYITNQDLVEHMLYVAAGKPLSVTQDDIKIDGWAFESRVYAEDPFRGFLPSIGSLRRCIPPEVPEDNSVRVDTGVVEGSEISMYYDPMIAKLCTHGKDRAEALENMRQALDSYVIRGLRHNISFLRSVCDHPKFISGEITTDFIKEEYPDGFHGDTVKEEALTSAVGAAACLRHIREALANDDVDTPDSDDWIVKFGDRVERVTACSSFNDDGVLYWSAQLASGPKVDVAFKRGHPLVPFASYSGADAEDSNVDGVIQVLNETSTGYRLQIQGAELDFQVLNERENKLFDFMPVKHAADLAKTLISPMPGIINSVSVSVGDKVEAGEEMVVIEAMKMQNIFKAEVSGTIKAIHFKQGETVAADDVVIELE